MNPRVKNSWGSRAGQTTVEYILLIAIVVSLFAIVARVFKDRHIAENLASPLDKKFKYAYQYGSPDARGPDDGGAQNHPRVVGGNNFRIFLGTKR